MKNIKLNTNKPRLLLHICCAGCGVYVSRELTRDFAVTLYFYNPNIFPEKEYQLRLKETEKIAAQFNINLIVGEYNHHFWLKKIKGYELEPEKGKRCLICYEDRLRQTANYARSHNFPFFATTLTVSPHKDARAISRIGQQLAIEFSVKYLDRDFKKQDGFKKTCLLSRQLNLYRQNYCGCEFSRRN